MTKANLKFLICKLLLLAMLISSMYIIVAFFFDNLYNDLIYSIAKTNHYGILIATCLICFGFRKSKK